MLKKKLKIDAESGLKARPAAALVDLANQFIADLKLTHKDREADLKSIVGIMSLALTEGEEVTILADGVDEEEAIEAISEFLEEKLK